MIEDFNYFSLSDALEFQIVLKKFCGQGFSV